MSEPQIVHDLIAELERREKVSLADATAAVCRLPLDGATLDAVVRIVRERRSTWAEALEQAVTYRRHLLELRSGAAGPAPASPLTLDGLLVSPARPTVKVKALVQATRSADPESANAVRRHIDGETNPFVLATMASVLGRAGDPADAVRLIPLLENGDARVVANALQALYLLHVDVEPERLIELANRPDARVRANALAMLGRHDQALVLERIEDLVGSHDESTRAGIAYLLGEMTGHPQVLRRLFLMFAIEERTGVLKQIAQAVKKHASPRSPELVIGPLWDLQRKLSGVRLALVKLLLHEVGVELGMVSTQVAEVGEKFAGSAAPQPTSGASLDGDVPLTFNDTWGPVSNPPSGGLERVGSTATPKPPPPRSRMGLVALSTGLLTVLLWFALVPAPPAEPPSSPARLQAAGPGPAPRARMRTQLPAEKRPEAAVSSASFAAPDVAERLGPVGASVELEGTVAGVSPGRAVVRCNGRYYVVRREGLEKLAPGARIRYRGRIAGVAANGLIFLEDVS